MSTKIVKAQVRYNRTQFLYCLILIVFGVIGAVQVALNGTGTESGNVRRGLKGLISGFLRDMEANGHGDIVQWIVVGIFVLVAVLSLIRGIQFFRRCAPGRTPMGASILSQAGPGADIWEVCAQIDRDMELGAKEFAGVFISSRWIMDTSAMRLDRIARIGRDEDGACAICLTDVDGRRASFDLLTEEDQTAALRHLRSVLPPDVPIDL